MKALATSLARTRFDRIKSAAPSATARCTHRLRSSHPTGRPDAEALGRLRELDPAGKNQLLARAVTAFPSLERLLPDLSQARGQQPADLDGIRRVCHTLKSSSASLGAPLSRRCAELKP